MFKYILQRVSLALITIIAIVVIVYLLTAAFQPNPFATTDLINASTSGGSGDSSGGSGGSRIDKAALINNAIQKSKEYYILPADYPAWKPGDGDAWSKVKLNPFIRLGYWFASLKPKSAGNPFPFGQIIPANGNSTLVNEVIPEYVFSFLKYSIILSLPSFVISAILGIILGIVAGYKRGTIIDGGINLFSQFFSSLPSFVLAPVAIAIFVQAFNIAPIAYAPTPQNLDPNSTVGLNRIITSLISPILVLIIGSLAGYIIYTRNQVVTVLTSNYVLIAKAKGLSKTQIFFRYVLRNISIPLASILIPSYIGLLTGSFVIERYYQYPGISIILTNAFSNGMINLIMFNLFFFTSLSVFTGIIVDVSYLILDPSISFASSGQSWFVLFKQKMMRDKQFREIEQANKAALGS